MITKSKILEQIQGEQKDRIIKHFDTIYETIEISDHEENIIYLAWLLKNGHLHVSTDCSMPIYKGEEVEFDLEKYEITFEDIEGGGYNFDLIISFYEIDELQMLL